MKYSNTLIAVKDMDASLAFYKEFFDQDVILDFGWCKTLSCGLTLQLFFDKIAGFDESTMHYKSNTMELYFVTEDFDGFIDLLKKHPEVELVHEAKEFPWHQRGIHIYDPNGHMLEISEDMYVVAKRLFLQGLSIEETVKESQHPIEMVQDWHRRFLEEQKDLLK